MQGLLPHPFSGEFTRKSSLAGPRSWLLVEILEPHSSRSWVMTRLLILLRHFMVRKRAQRGRDSSPFIETQGVSS